ncbi:thiol peroxidase [Vibrio coralliilyticus]|uniref:thiol peroxidase n=1 Tax=Vibrio coralliilyticus TaxID=190893 RepID=UPI001560D60D|nr:thiol peroxidase [Vibrio coralliilyticus]NRF12906.1 thiol peroxidase [Vibrio coralliilyticus]
MQSVTFLGEAIQLAGSFPQVGQQVPAFSLTTVELSEITQSSYEGNNIILVISPSIDTPVCQETVTKFDELASTLTDTTVICASADLPFALDRYQKENSLENIIMASNFRSSSFASDFGIELAEGPLKSLCARAVIVFNKSGSVVHAELVKEITNKPDFSAATSAL